MGAYDLYLANRALIDRALATLCRRHRLPAMDAEDFSSSCRLHLIEDDCAVLRAFLGRSSLQTYLITVITHYFQDWRNAQWGKWRPSTAARRLGPLAVRLETLLSREGFTFEEAVETLRTTTGAPDLRPELERIAASLPARQPRRFTDPAELETIASRNSPPDAGLECADAAATAAQATTRLAEILEALPAQDRLVLRLRFSDGIHVSEIARLLRLDARSLYPRIKRVLAGLRSSLEASGITAEAMAHALDAHGFDRVDDGVDENAGPVRRNTRDAHPSTAGRTS